MVLKAFGVSRTEAEIRQDSKCKPEGTEPDDLVEAAKKYGFASSMKERYLSFNQLRKRLQQGHYPIVYLGVSLLTDTRAQKHSVVVFEIDREGVHILDPVLGERTIPRRIFEEQWEDMHRVTIVIS